MRKILLVALTAAAMVSCSENEGLENESTMNRIKFGTVVKTGTKTLVATTENFSKFTVSAYKTTDDMGGTVQLNTGFMDDIEVDKSSGEWKYKGDYYWPVSGKLQFFATSPAQTLDITTAAGYPKFEYAVKAVDSQEDLVAANVINQVKSESAISLPFQHLLTQVNFTIKGDVADFIYTVSKLVINGAKLLQKSEMRKNMVMDLIYRGFIYAANYSESHYNPRRSQIKTELRYLFVTTLNR